MVSPLGGEVNVLAVVVVIKLGFSPMLKQFLNKMYNSPSKAITILK